MPKNKKNKSSHLYEGGVPLTVFNAIKYGCEHARDFREISLLAAAECYENSYNIKKHMNLLEKNGYIVRTEKGRYEWYSAIKQS